MTVTERYCTASAIRWLSWSSIPAFRLPVTSYLFKFSRLCCVDLWSKLRALERPIGWTVMRTWRLLNATSLLNHAMPVNFKTTIIVRWWCLIVELFGQLLEVIGDLMLLYYLLSVPHTSYLLGLPFAIETCLSWRSFKLSWHPRMWFGVRHIVFTLNRTQWSVSVIYAWSLDFNILWQCSSLWRWSCSRLRPFLQMNWPCWCIPLHNSRSFGFGRWGWTSWGWLTLWSRMPLKWFFEFSWIRYHTPVS